MGGGGGGGGGGVLVFENYLISCYGRFVQPESMPR